MKRCQFGVVCSLVLVALSFGCAKEMPAAKVSPGDTVKETADTKKTAKPAAESARASEATEIALEAASSDGLNRLKPEEIAEGWIRLFDGHTLFGWKSNTSLSWSVKDGILTADSDRSEDKCLLVTTSQFADYELRCDYKVAPGGNSGIFLRTAFVPKDPAVDCYELNMCDSHPEFGTGSLVKRVKPLKTVTGDGDWHTLSARLEGTRITAKFDGEEVLDFKDESETSLSTGFIGLQMNGGKIEFRNVFLKPLGTKPLFDGSSLNGWHVVPGSSGRFEAKEETIHAVGGRGFLETDAVAGDFVFQFEAKVNGDRLNSGVFFRAMTGTEKAPSNGYEFQLHNGFKNENRAEPEDHGTGAIFRRIAARRVVANDREWLTGTLVASGSHFATWVNGIQVVDWTDTRQEHANPREGLRLEPGHFILQGHDETTDIQFRNLRFVDTPSIKR